MTQATGAAPRVAALVLAAGHSTRMGGANKLLARVDGAPVVARAVDAALASRAEPVVVVTGHEAERVARALGARRVRLVHNADHAKGLSASLRAGLDALSDSVDGALVCLGDMPWVTAAHLDALVAVFARRAPEGPPICVPVFDGERGNPVLWPARHFDALRAVEGDTGGRDLLHLHASEVRQVPVPDDGVRRDVDVPTDLP